MIRRRRDLGPLSLVLALVLGCDSPVDTPAPHGGLDLRLELTTGSVVDGGVVRVRGDAIRNVTIAPGETREIELDPGTYSVALEGLMAGAVVMFGERENVTVQEGQFTTVNLTLTDFVPTFSSVPAQAQAGQDFTIRWNPVAGAASYDVVIGDDPDFSTVLGSESTTETSLTLSLGDGGDHYFQVRARNRFESLGMFSEVSSGVMVLVGAPTVAEHGAMFAPLDCSAGDPAAFAYWETVEYADPSGDFPTGEDVPESGGRIQSQFRTPGGDWTDYGFARTWMPQEGADGESGELLSGVCFRSGFQDEERIDLRVRLASADGEFGDWDETQLFLPMTVEVDPERVDLQAGETADLEAVARDVNDDVVPGDPIRWSNFNPAVGSVDQDGLYTVAGSGPGGLDRAYARAGYAQTSVAVEGPNGLTEASWWAPCWVTPPLEFTDGMFLRMRMPTYAGQEYRVVLRDHPQAAAASGDADLFLRLGQPPTTSDYDEISAGETHEELLVYPAAQDDVLWMGIYAFSDFQNVQFAVFTNDGRCGFPGNGFDPGASTVTPRSPAAAPLPATAGTLRSARDAMAEARTRRLREAPADDGRRADRVHTVGGG